MGDYIPGPNSPPPQPAPPRPPKAPTAKKPRLAPVPAPERNRRQRATPAPKAATPKVRSWQQPLKQTPDYPETIHVFIQDDQGVPLHLTKGTATVATKAVAHKWKASWIPRRGDEIVSREARYVVQTVRWTYAIAGAPGVSIIVKPLPLKNFPVQKN